jgi:hypothetical protein
MTKGSTMANDDIWIGDNDVRRKLDGAELAEFLAVRAEMQKLKDDEATRAAQRAVDKAALLQRLGLTADEAALLIS